MSTFEKQEFYRFLDVVKNSDNLNSSQKLIIERFLEMIKRVWECDDYV